MRLAASLLLLSLSAAAHEKGPTARSKPAPDYDKRLSKISESYGTAIRPIFEAKCFNCHSDRTEYPWYYKIPGVKQFIDSGIAEAREHLDMSHGFPFKGHREDPVEETLKEIGAMIAEGEMPPWYYIPLHGGSRLTDGESKAILAWVKKSRDLLMWEE
ncbi:MAG TPA: heme-binding domain-containing protein [Bdellovibrionota bacterium]|nr:heme-binding domain-containing protein [Bdellovibrionota bacterium]